MMAAQPRPNYESSSSKAYDALIDQLENLPSPSNEPEITFNEPAPAQQEMNNDAQPAPPTIAAPIQDETAQSHGNSFPQGLILPAQEPQVQSAPPTYNNFNGYAQPREESKPTYAPPPVQSPPSYALPQQNRMPAPVNDKYSGYPSIDHSESSSTSYPSLETSSAEDKIKNILQMYPGNPQQKPQPIMPQVQPVAPQPVVSQPQFSQPHSSPQMQPARPVYNQIPPQQMQAQPQAQPQLNSLYAQPSPVQQPKPVQQQQVQPAIPSPQLARPQTLTPQPVAQPTPAPSTQQVQQLAQAQIQSQQINQQTVQVQVQQQQQIQVLQAQQLQQQNMIQQQIQYSKEMCIQMQSYFERIARFMENVDKRLNNLERVTNDMLKNTSHTSGNANPVYPASTPSEVPIENMFDRSELERLKKLQSQFDDDAAVARRLQEEYEREAKQASSKPSTSTPTPKPTSTPAPKSSSEKYEICPICQVQIVASKLTQHVNECLDGPSAYSDTKTPTPTPTPDEKKGFWSSLFGGKKEDGKPETATPTPSQPVYDLGQNPPQNSKGTYYPAVVPNGTPAYPPNGTPGYPPNGYPMVYPYQFPGNQPMYYYMPAQPQTQPKK
mmetsp:Transcript_10517/g.14395  ORF Transcript_10517/g.14395 Transcript_10517/m.14395 type:complete len:607 (-) Transcript_10517:43-1863(-)|eukprot:CAMPEP_0168567938 /NCGR_PEP_ID=MMETSP0413-20121227/15294_1 /TAXON_ID=136452 /ORGANISM="Filamoeba nolandi, Strain NC-AS-23-1" /LENGTH=606 /DNA_ID=CAMNT_0008600207 /DNA_START=120 /DNA_END=1940 /DNA_ORIENTATION=-